jgi:AcrR family transcriptional regulator
MRKGARNPAKRSAILKAAEKVFAARGFHEARISDIAGEAHVSDATIYEYFSTKEELLFSIPADTIREYLEKNLEILAHIKKASDKLRTLIARHLSLYAHNEDYANVVMLILKGNRNFLKTDAYKVVQASARITTHVLEEGIRTGEFRADLEPHLVRAMIWGTIEHLVIRKSLLGKPEDLLSIADDITDTILGGIVASHGEPTLNVRLTISNTSGKES